jgi:broad specificity phosphatase PhoE
MARVYLARHGETDWNARGKLQGRTDIPLNDAGIAQAKSLAERLRGAGVTAVRTSSLSRARVTGTIVAEALGIDTVTVDEELVERSFGVFEGLTRDECAAQYPAAWKAWVDQTAPPQGAEGLGVAVARLNRALERMVHDAEPGSSLVVSHGGVMRLWLMELYGKAVPLISNGTVYVVDHVDGHFTATRL